jgi:hypothetical protein
MNNKCPICSGDVEPWYRRLNSVYNKHYLGRLCNCCGNKADSFIDYYGSKKKEDVGMLLSFINTGNEPKRRLRAMMNAGYY